MAKRLTEAVAAWAWLGPVARRWRAFEDAGHLGDQPCYIVPKAEYERLLRMERRVKRVVKRARRK